jgi:uncharacterized membrane protein YeaQ/YmgE (transglycosylase-associated protein family)
MLTTLLIAIVVGATAGWLASQFVFSPTLQPRDIITGIAGALVAATLFGYFGLTIVGHGGLIGLTAAATIGAVILLLIVRLLRQFIA